MANALDYISHTKLRVNEVDTLLENFVCSWLSISYTCMRCRKLSADQLTMSSSSGASGLVALEVILSKALTVQYCYMCNCCIAQMVTGKIMYRNQLVLVVPTK